VTNWLEDIPIPDAITDANELQEYLSQPAEHVKVNPLCRWWDKCYTWPALS
jgi:hypothetical protein